MLTIAFFEPNGWVGKFVSLFTGSRWCHVALLHDVLGTAMITQAHPRYGTCVWSVGRAATPDYLIDLSWIPEDWAARWLTNQWGSFYDWRDIFAFGLRLRHPRSQTGLICSELVIRLILAAAEVHPIPAFWGKVIDELRTRVPGSVSPGKLFDILQLAAKI